MFKNILIFLNISRNIKFLVTAQYLNDTNCIEKYNNFILINDSFLITKSLNNLKNAMNNNYDVISISESYERKYHLPDFFRCYNKNSIKIILNLYNDENIKKK